MTKNTKVAHGKGSVAIIGAGVNGMFCAYYLLKMGYRVKVLDKVADGLTSKNNAGLLTPSLTPAPKISTSEVIKALTGGDGPISISPLRVAADPIWFLKAAKYANDESRTQKIIDMGKDSLKLYTEFFGSEKINADVKKGVAALYSSTEEARRLSKKYHGKFIGEKSIRSLGYTELQGGIIFKDELSINPIKLFAGLREKIIELGARMEFGDEAKLYVRGGSVECIRAGAKKIYADKYIATAGSWSGRLLGPTKINPHIEPARGFSMLFSTGGRKIISAPALLEDYGIAIAQHSANLVRITSFFELQGMDHDLKKKKEEWLLGIIKKHLINYAKMKLIKKYYGFRPCTPNNMPVIGAAPEIDNLFIATGQCRLGVTLAPITGKIISEMIDRRPIKKYMWLREFVKN
ncbi:MAG: FAD-binding oxidoreductase [Candidatus Marsarchaeota archaeon]|nr:FAD-binding oxidoreductase [Candidatus Marsarchaeota archaeon]MCL5106369.1 FAD-binding oxidoreductase [Candidatus Marsarchaeota archaeon]